MNRTARGRATDDDVKSLSWRLLLPNNGPIHLGSTERGVLTSCGRQLDPVSTEVRIPAPHAVIGCSSCKRTVQYRRFQVDQMSRA